MIPLSNVGQGLQRSFIISTIRTLNESYKQDHDNSASTIKMIDEPELFQHYKNICITKFCHAIKFSN